MKGSILAMRMVVLPAAVHGQESAATACCREFDHRMPAASTAGGRTGQRPRGPGHSTSKVAAGDAAGRQCVGCQVSCTPLSSSHTGTTGAMSSSRRGKQHQARACLSPSVTSTTSLEPRRARGVPIVHPPAIISPVPIGACVFPGRTLQRRACVGLAEPGAGSAAATEQHLQRPGYRPQTPADHFRFNCADAFGHEFRGSTPNWRCRSPGEYQTRRAVLG